MPTNILNCTIILSSTRMRHAVFTRWQARHLPARHVGAGVDIIYKQKQLFTSCCTRIGLLMSKQRMMFVQKITIFVCLSTYSRFLLLVIRNSKLLTPGKRII